MYSPILSLALSCFLAVMSHAQNTTISIDDSTDLEIANGTALADIAALSNQNLRSSSTCSVQSASTRMEWQAALGAS